jgi:Glycosyl transferase family 90
MVHFSIRNGTATWEPEYYHARMLGEWISNLAADVLPDIDLKINVLDEPRVLAPYDTVALSTELAHSHSRPHKASGNTNVNWLSVGKQGSWEAMLTSCSINSPARREAYDETISDENTSLHFVANVTASMDVCASVDLRNQHGFFESPNTLLITHSLVPILSQCTPSIFNDIIYPSPYYASEMMSDNINEAEDVDWDQKLDRVYWSGTATGGHSNAKTWMSMHRQRLALMTASDSTMLVSLLRRAAGGVWQSYQSTWAKISSMFYLRITRTAQCEKEACDEMNLRFHSEKEPLSASFGSKYAIDIDGNTFSGRYYRLLKSKSCVLKLTVFREWHDDRLVPWVHYIPVSTGAEELGELVRFLIEDDVGKEIGRRIADQGRTWANKVLRRTDMEIAFFRLLIEYARLISVEREDMWFD